MVIYFHAKEKGLPSFPTCFGQLPQNKKTMLMPDSRPDVAYIQSSGSIGNPRVKRKPRGLGG
jgi:hypothetical protein